MGEDRVKKKAVFLDRDGTINEDRGYVYKTEDFVFLPHALEGMRLLQESGFLLIIITNQSGIARGYYTEDDYQRLMKNVYSRCDEKGVKISADYYCPHHPDAVIDKYRKECDCRKPQIGLFEKAIREWNIDLSQSYCVGDSERDLSICKVAECKGYLIGGNKKCERPYFNIVASLYEAARRIDEDNNR